ncbi:MAG TPA: sigma 54-interacting transcriptional regulator [Bryobacteraceae bacterium]|nr:sigma 54-interacting transcriptional regulator [Bryobacteraceae bacterium]
MANTLEEYRVPGPIAAADVLAAEIQRTRTLLEAIVDGSQAVIYVKDMEGRFLLVNKQFESLFYITKDQAKGKTDYDLFPVEQADTFRANDEAVARAGQPMEWEEIVHVNGEQRTYISLKFPLLDALGNLCGTAGVSTDITQRKRTEEALRESEERFRQLVASIQDHGLIMLDRAGMVISWNTGAERITGYKAEEVIGEYGSRFYTAEDIASRLPEEELQAAAARGRSEAEGWRVRKDHSRYWAQVITTALHDRYDALLGFARVIREDVSIKTEDSGVRLVGQAAHPVRPVIAESPVMVDVLRFARRVAQSEANTILLEGENGTGKDLIAKIMHDHSRRQAEPFIAINCAAIPETLLESELFGYEKGAFTDARAQKRGTLELANKGTLFLDEIGELPLVLQAKLLRVLEEQRFRRLGGLQDIQVDLRVITATNRNLLDAVGNGAFRQDLYFRLNVIAISLPPLRNRREDILPLANFFIEQLNRKFRRKVEGISPEASKVLVAHCWPGNVRELRNAIERAMILEDSNVLTPRSLPVEVTNPDTAKAWAPPHEYRNRDELPSLEDNELSLVRRALEKSSGNQSRAARLLRITRDTLRYKMKKFGLR